MARGVQTRVIRLSAGEIVVHESGPVDGRPLLCLHGALVSASIWRPLCDQLAPDYRVIMPELPLGAHPRPMDPDANLSPHGVARLVSELIPSLGLTKATVVGNDTGGAIAQLLAAHRPERVERLILTNCDAFEVFPPRGYGYLKLLPRLPRIAALIGAAFARFPRLGLLPLAWGSLARDLPMAMLTEWTSAANNRGVQRDGMKFFAGVRPEITLTAVEALSEHQRPTLLAWGTADRFFPMSLAQRLADALPNARIDPMDGARTYVMLDEPRQLARAIEAFA